MSTESGSERWGNLASTFRTGVDSAALAIAVRPQLFDLPGSARAPSATTRVSAHRPRRTRLRPIPKPILVAFRLPKALKRASLKPDDIDVWEVHEAYSAQALGSCGRCRESWTASLFPTNA